MHSLKKHKLLYINKQKNIQDVFTFQILI